MRLLAVILFLLTTIELKSQSYVPLVVDSSHWIIEQCDYVALPPIGQATEYYILGDTVVNSTQYKKVYMRYWDFQFCSLGQPATPYQLFSLIREDTVARRVYSTGGGFACPSGNDTLMYDFNLQVGDTVNTCITDFQIINAITIGNPWLSSTTYSSSAIHKMYEGVGSSFGLYEWMVISTSGGGDPWLTFYCRGDLSNCGLILDVNKNKETDIEIYPNPTSSSFTIEGVFKPYNLSITDALGRIVYVEKDISNSSKTLDIRSYPEGLYIVRIESDGEVLTKKLIKE